MRRSTLTMASLLILIVFAITARAQKERFAGTFVAEDRNTGGITRIDLFDDDTVNVWGKCHPTDCDWGIESVVAYAPSVDADLRSSAKALSAIYVHRHAVTVLIIKPLKDGKVSVDVFTRFTDGSRRSAYTARYIMVPEKVTL